MFALIPHFSKRRLYSLVDALLSTEFQTEKFLKNLKIFNFLTIFFSTHFRNVERCIIIFPEDGTRAHPCRPQTNGLSQVYLFTFFMYKRLLSLPEMFHLFYLDFHNAAIHVQQHSRQILKGKTATTPNAFNVETVFF